MVAKDEEEIAILEKKPRRDSFEAKTSSGKYAFYLSFAGEILLQTANIVKSFLGSNWLGLPFAISKSGVFLGMIMIAMVSIITDFTCQLLISSKTILNMHIKKEEDRKELKLPWGMKGVKLPKGFLEEDGDIMKSWEEERGNVQEEEVDIDLKLIRTYGGIVGVVLGKKWKILLDLLLIFSQCGFCIGYFIFIPQTVCELLGVENYGLGVRALGVVILFILELPLVFLRDVSKLGITSILGWFALMIGLFITFSAFDFHSASEVKYFDFKSFPLCLGLLAGAFEGIGMVLPVEHEMRDVGNPPGSRYPSLLHGVIFFVYTVLTSIGVLGYLTYGSDTEQIITLNLDAGVIATIIQLSLVSAIYFTVPLVLYPASDVFEVAFFREEAQKVTSGVFAYWKRCAVSVGLMIIISLVAIFVPEFGLIGSFVGSVGGSSLAYIIPSILTMKLYEMEKWMWVIQIFILVYGLFVLLTGTFFSTIAIIRSY